MQKNAARSIAIRIKIPFKNRRGGFTETFRSSIPVNLRAKPEPRNSRPPCFERDRAKFEFRGRHLITTAAFLFTATRNAKRKEKKKRRIDPRVYMCVYVCGRDVSR